MDTPALPVDPDRIRRDVASGDLHTVALAIPDMQGRLQGKRFDAAHFADIVATHGAEACDYLLAVDIDMEPIPGVASSNWETGYGDYVLSPDLGTWRVCEWQDGTALVLADVTHHDGTPVEISPRQILRRQLAELEKLGLSAQVGTELEFCLYDTDYAEAWRTGYRDLRPSSRYNIDYSLTGTSPSEPVIRAIRRGMARAGLHIESSKGECNLGQHEVTFRYAEALTACDNHVLYKSGVKEIAALHGQAATFMAKPDQREGNSCHIHLSLLDTDGLAAFPQDERHPSEMSQVMRAFLAGQLACLPEFMLLFAPNINSYKRYAAGSFAPDSASWGYDNRTCALRVVGSGPGLRFEHRVPGGDVNPYLAVAGMISAGIQGVRHQLQPGDPCSGNAYANPGAPVPRDLKEAVELWKASETAHKVFGDTVVEHYATVAQAEVDAFAATVTEWERYRGFERM